MQGFGRLLGLRRFRMLFLLLKHDLEDVFLVGTSSIPPLRQRFIGVIRI